MGWYIEKTNIIIMDTNEEILEKLRLDRPNQVIHEVLSVEKNEYGFYNVMVDMETMFFETKIKHHKQVLPYPFSEYIKLNEQQKLDWRWENL